MNMTGKMIKSAAILLLVATAVVATLHGCGSESYDVAAPVVDPTAPITVDGNKASTFNSIVPVALHAEDTDGIVGYFLSENSTAPLASDAGWVAVTSAAIYDATVNYTFADPATYGIKTVYVWFKDSLGNIVGNGSDTIEYKQFISGGGGC